SRDATGWPARARRSRRGGARRARAWCRPFASAPSGSTAGARRRRSSMGDAALASTLARLSSEEMVTALGLSRAPSWVRQASARAFTLASRPLGNVLARFDARVVTHGLPY